MSTPPPVATHEAPQHQETDAHEDARASMLTIIVNVLLVVELSFAMYMGTTSGGDLTLTFISVFLPLALVTLVGAFLFKRFYLYRPRRQTNA